MLLSLMVQVIIAFLGVLGSFHMLLGPLHNPVNMISKGGSFLEATFRTHNKIKWYPQWLPIHQLSR